MKQNKALVKTIKTVEGWGEGLAFIVFPVLFVTAQLLHPTIFTIQQVSDGMGLIEHFRGQSGLHTAHFLEFLCVFPLVAMGLHYKKRLLDEAPLLVATGAYMAVTGALMLLANKSALCLTISGFDTLDDSQLYAITPALDVLLEKRAYLSVLWLLPLLPLGFALIGAALIKTRRVPLWQSVPLVIGSLLLANPEIELINFFASFFLAAGLIPYGIHCLRTNGMEAAA